MALCNEFELISRYFNTNTVSRSDVVLGIGDDCALLKPPSQQLIAVSTDTLVAGIHFYPDILPEDLAYRALMVNLSDLAAVGAEPAWLSLALTLPTVDEAWVARFSHILQTLCQQYQLQLIGGDTTKGPLSITLTIHGLVPEKTALRRNGAQPGDLIYVSGYLGDSAAGLAILDQCLSPDNTIERDYLLSRYFRPTARVELGQALRGIASSAIDLSDGLIADLPHILRASQCGAEIELEALPLSSALVANVEQEQAWRWAVSGGEDFELCFTIPPIHQHLFQQIINSSEIPLTLIGNVTAGESFLQFFYQHKEHSLTWQGYDHFRGER